jgi:mannosidase alpha-like ER degradation enhancer 2
VRAIWNRRSSRGLLGNHINIFTGEWTYKDAGIGHGIDSFYEYLLKAAIYFDDGEYYRIFQEALPPLCK